MFKIKLFYLILTTTLKVLMQIAGIMKVSLGLQDTNLVEVQKILHDSKFGPWAKSVVLILFVKKVLRLEK